MHKVCELLKISFLKLNKSRKVKKYDEQKNKKYHLYHLFIHKDSRLYEKLHFNDNYQVKSTFNYFKKIVSEKT
jgi:hypothetical protein